MIGHWIFFFGGMPELVPKHIHLSMAVAVAPYTGASSGARDPSDVGPEPLEPSAQRWPGPGFLGGARGCDGRWPSSCCCPGGNDKDFLGHNIGQLGMGQNPGT